MIELFDSHAHYDDEKFNNDREEILTKIQEKGISYCVSAGYSISSSEYAIRLSKEYNFIYATCGISPNDIPKELNNIDKDIEKIKELAKNEKVVAIGEIGLDYYWNKENKEIQKEYFKKQIQLANELELPIVIHTRDAAIDTIEILKSQEITRKGIFHCCPMNLELVKKGLELGFMISLAGPITFKNAKNADEMIKNIPLESMIIETDSPYLTPEPKRGTRNDSRNLEYIVEKIAQVKNLTTEEVAEETMQNAKRIYGIN